ncbi:MAG TPA: ABC-three component system protein [Bacteroidia bacterium]
MSVTYPVRIQVWAAAGGHCCKCKTNLVKSIKDNKDKSAQGEVAHIEGENNGAKRYNSKQTDTERNSFANLMLMCPNDHTEIDNDEVTYTVPILIKMKSDHEGWVASQLKVASFNISFSELEVTLKYLTGNSMESESTTYKVIPPTEKISKNKLSSTVSEYITMGMIRTELIHDYLNRNPDMNFSNRLRNGFVEKYNELRKSKNGDELFWELLDFAGGGSTLFSHQAAGLTVLVYFFQICDIFES